jgi:hypothetical protein
MQGIMETISERVAITKPTMAVILAEIMCLSGVLVFSDIMWKLK